MEEPGPSKEINEVGTYRQNGNSIYLEFSHYSIDASITGDRMKGMITFKESNRKKELIAARPAKGHRWVHPNDPRDFRVEPIP